MQAGTGVADCCAYGVGIACGVCEEVTDASIRVSPTKVFLFNRTAERNVAKRLLIRATES